MNIKQQNEEIEFIPNWTIWNPSCQITLWKDIEESIYNASIDIFLTDYPEPIRCITTMTQIWCSDPLCVVRQAAESVGVLFEEVYEDVMVVNFDDGNPIEEVYTLSQAFGNTDCDAKEEIITMEA